MAFVQRPAGHGAQGDRLERNEPHDVGGRADGRCRHWLEHDSRHCRTGRLGAVDLLRGYRSPGRGSTLRREPRYLGPHAGRDPLEQSSFDLKLMREIHSSLRSHGGIRHVRTARGRTGHPFCQSIWPPRLAMTSIRLFPARVLSSTSRLPFARRSSSRNSSCLSCMATNLV